MCHAVFFFFPVSSWSSKCHRCFLLPLQCLAYKVGTECAVLKATAISEVWGECQHPRFALIGSGELKVHIFQIKLLLYI